MQVVDRELGDEFHRSNLKRGFDVSRHDERDDNGCRRGNDPPGESLEGAAQGRFSYNSRFVGHLIDSLEEGNTTYT